MIFVALIARGGDNAAPLLLIQAALEQLLAVHERLSGEHTDGELLAAHLKVEHGDRLAARLRGVHRDVHRDGGLAHTGTGGNEDELALVQTEDLAVEVDKSGRETGQALAALLRKTA